MFDLSLICNSTLYFSTAYKCRKWDLCTCDGLPTRKTYRKTTMCCKHLLWVANSNTVTTNQQQKNIYNQNITVGTSHNKHLSWATVATFLDGIGWFHKKKIPVHCPNKQSCTYRCTVARLEKLWTVFSYCSHKQILYGTWVRGIAFYIYQYIFTKELLIFMLQANTIKKKNVHKLSPLALVELILHSS